MRFPRSHYHACLEADVLTESSGLGSSKHDSRATSKKRYSDTTIQRYRELELEPEPEPFINYANYCI